MRFWRIVVLLVTIICLVFPITPISAQDDEKPKTVEYIVSADAANLRTGAGTNFEVAGSVSKGDSLLIYDETPETQGWLRVYREGEDDAYIADFLVERAPMRFYPPDQEPILEASGRGSNITDVYEIPRGAYRIDATVQDRSFILSSVAVEGDCDDETIFNELDFDSNQLVISALFVSSGCSIIFQADNVDGNWEFALRDILNEEVLFETMLTIETETSIAGKGRTVTMATLLPEGIWSITATVDDSAFILQPQVLSGECDGFSVMNEFSVDEESLEISAIYRSEGEDDGEGCIIFWETSNVEGEWEIVFENLG